MGSVRCRTKRLESVISIFVLIILILIGVGVFVKQSDYDMSRFGIGGDAEYQMSDVEVLLETDALLPEGFEALLKTEVYGSENLYEKINGKAPLYTEAGFLKLFTRRFVSAKDQSQLMELFVYDMGAVRNAFSVYSTQRRPDAEGLWDSEFAYRTSNALYLAYGKYYIELTGSSDSAELVEAMMEVGRKVRENLSVGDECKIEELALLDADDIVPGSIKLYSVNAFGFEGLMDIFTAEYDIDGKRITAFLSKWANSGSAEVAAESYRNFLIENGATAKDAINNAMEGKILDVYGTIEIIFTTGPFAAGVHEAENQEEAEEIAVRFMDKLRAQQ